LWAEKEMGEREEKKRKRREKKRRENKGATSRIKKAVKM
jgi:hypothetical protein